MTTPNSPAAPPPGGQPVAAITGASGYLGSVLVTAFGAAGLRGPSPGSVAGRRERRPLLRPELARFVRCPRWGRPARPLRLRHDADQEVRHLAVERLRRGRFVRPGRLQRGATDHRAVVDVGLSGDTSVVRSGQARNGGGGTGSRGVRRPPGFGLRNGLGWDGRDAAPAGCPSGASRLRASSAAVHRLGAGFCGCPARPGPGRASACFPRGRRSPRPGCRSRPC